MRIGLIVDRSVATQNGSCPNNEDKPIFDPAIRSTPMDFLTLRRSTAPVRGVNLQATSLHPGRLLVKNHGGLGRILVRCHEIGNPILETRRRFPEVISSPADDRRGFAP